MGHSVVCGRVPIHSPLHYKSLYSTHHQLSGLCALITQEPCTFNITHPYSQFNLYTGSMSVLGVEISICSIRVSLRKRTRW